ncbi:MAG TPA: HAD-IA family hydrolase [Smithella sp.]|nr:HAD-IA family hydrolase [Smithella sp.]
MKELDLMIFDFDGTLVTTGTDLALSINHTLEALGLEKKPEKEIISFVGDGIATLIQRALGPDHVQFQDQALIIFVDYYSKHLLDNAALYPHVEDVLKHFENKTKVILTNKSYDFTMMIVRRLNIEKYFTEIVGIDSTPFAKPDGRVIDYLLNKYGVVKEKALMTGDGKNDILVARNSGILSMAYLNGLGGREDLLNLHADYYCEDLLEINSLFN